MPQNTFNSDLVSVRAFMTIVNDLHNEEWKKFLLNFLIQYFNYRLTFNI
jgi:hypothetical protein